MTGKSNGIYGLAIVRWARRGAPHRRPRAKHYLGNPERDFSRPSLIMQTDFVDFQVMIDEGARKVAWTRR